MSIKNTIFEALLNRGKILSKPEIIAIIREYERRFKHRRFKDNKEENLVKYLSRHKYIKRIFSGLFYINSFDEKNREFSEFEDKEIVFMALNKLAVNWYLGLGSAIYVLGKTWQTPNQLSIVNTRFSGNKKILGLKVRFFKTKESLIFGLKKAKTKHDISYFYSDPVKTHIDRFYFKEIGSLIRVKNTKKYLKRYPKWIGKR